MTRAKRIPYGSDVSAGTFECLDCGKRIDTASKSSLPPCPDLETQPHPLKAWRSLSGQGDAKKDPYREEVR